MNGQGSGLSAWCPAPRLARIILGKSIPGCAGILGKLCHADAVTKQSWNEVLSTNLEASKHGAAPRGGEQGVGQCQGVGQRHCLAPGRGVGHAWLSSSSQLTLWNRAFVGGPPAAQGAYNCARAAYPYMKEQARGKVILMSVGA